MFVKTCDTFLIYEYKVAILCQRAKVNISQQKVIILNLKDNFARVTILWQKLVIFLFFYIIKMCSFQKHLLIYDFKAINVCILRHYFST